MRTHTHRHVQHHTNTVSLLCQSIPSGGARPPHAWVGVPCTHAHGHMCHADGDKLFFMSLHAQVVYVSTCAEMYLCVTVNHFSYERVGYCMWAKCTCDHMYTVDSQSQEYHVAFEIDHNTTRHPHNYANTMCMCAEPHTHVPPPPSDGVTHSFADAAAAKQKQAVHHRSAGSRPPQPRLRHGQHDGDRRPGMFRQTVFTYAFMRLAAQKAVHHRSAGLRPVATPIARGRF